MNNTNYGIELDKASEEYVNSIEINDSDIDYYLRNAFKEGSDFGFDYFFSNYIDKSNICELIKKYERSEIRTFDSIVCDLKKLIV